MKDDDSDQHWADSPLSATDSDQLGRGPFTASVALRINNAKATDESTVFGLVGPWGSGKTSILNKVVDQLSGDWLIGTFSPWSTGDSTGMALEFVNALADLLDQKAQGELRSKLAGYAEYLAPGLAAIPVLGTGVEGIAAKVLGQLTQRPPWHVQFKALADGIEALGKRVLFVVDDIDRLQADELLTLLKVIRLLGRFRGVHYLVAYDQQTIEELLGGGGRSRLSSFMEKIVQYPFEVPLIPESTALRLVNESIEMLLKASGTSLSDLGLQRAVELAQLLSPEMTTPRTLGRFREQLRAFASHVQQAELDPLDFIAVTWLRLCAHEVWLELPHWTGELRSGKTLSAPTKTEDYTSDMWLKRIAETQSDRDPGSTLKLLSFLYSAVNAYGMSHFVAHERALSDDNYFGRYLLLAMPENDVSDSLVERALQSLLAGTPDEQSESLADIIDGDAERANLALVKVGKLRRPASPTSRTLIDFLAARMLARQADMPGVGAPRNSLRVWAAQECGRALRHGIASATDEVDWFGEEESFTIARFIARDPEFRSDKKSLLKGFAEYWAAQVLTRLEDLLSEGSKLGAIADLISFADAESASGLLDHAVSDYSEYLRVAEAFVMFEPWVESEVTYEMKFRGEPFKTLLSAGIRDRFRTEVESEVGQVAYETDDLDKPEVSADIKRAFVIDSIASWSRKDLP